MFSGFGILLGLEKETGDLLFKKTSTHMHNS